VVSGACVVAGEWQCCTVRVVVGLQGKAGVLRGKSVRRRIAPGCIRWLTEVCIATPHSCVEFPREAGQRRLWF
jgi:hypothetical protein